MYKLKPIFYLDIYTSIKQVSKDELIFFLKRDSNEFIGYNGIGN